MSLSYNEADLTTGQLMIRIMTAMILAIGIVGGPDAMLFWKEAGRRIDAEERLAAEVKEHEKTRKELDELYKIARERDEAQARVRELEAELERRNRRNGDG